MPQNRWQEAAADLLTVIESPASGVRTREGFDHLATCYEHLGEWQEAYRYCDSAYVYALRESDERFSAQLSDFDVRYKTMEKDMQIARLEAQRSRIIIIAVSASVLLLLLTLGLWLWLRQRRYRREAQLRISTLESERARIARDLHTASVMTSWDLRYRSCPVLTCPRIPYLPVCMSCVSKPAR